MIIEVEDRYYKVAKQFSRVLAAIEQAVAVHGGWGNKEGNGCLVK
jgi:hypothetical protein